MVKQTAWFEEIFASAGTRFGLEIETKLSEVKTAYQTIEIYQTRTFGKLMVIDGCIMLTERDNFLYHEMMSHPALFTHPNPEKIAIIGGGDCGTLTEVLKHKQVKQVTQIEIDEAVTELSKQFFPDLCEGIQDPRAQLRFEDGIAWTKAQTPNSWDIMIIDSTDPVGHAEGLFQTEFLASCLRCLNKDGLLIQQSESPLLHTDTLIKDLHHNLREAGFKKRLTLNFPQPVYPSGWWSATLASKSAQLPEFRRQDAINKTFETRYYNAHIHQGALAQPEFMKNALTIDD